MDTDSEVQYPAKHAGGRPVEDKITSDEEVIENFRAHLREGLLQIEEKFIQAPSRTDSYRLMIVRLCKRVISDSLSKIGIFSYCRSTDVDKYLPENEKRFTQMIWIIKDMISTNASNAPEAPHIFDYVS